MITYELAKKLKDVGFPQGTYSNSDRSYIDQDAWQLPTLSELIEACGKPIWIEGSNILEFAWMAGQGKGMDTPLGRGSTPEEAVANLWLALHK